MSTLILVMLTLKLFSFCFSNWINSTLLASSLMTFSFSYWYILTLNPSIEFFSLGIVFFSSIISIWFFSYIFYLFVGILMFFIHCYLDLNNHPYDCYFELLILGKSHISISLRAVFGALSHSLVWNLCLFFSFSLTLWAGFFTWNEIAMFFTLDRVVLHRRWNVPMGLGQRTQTEQNWRRT